MVVGVRRFEYHIAAILKHLRCYIDALWPHGILSEVQALHESIGSQSDLCSQVVDWICHICIHDSIMVVLHFTSLTTLMSGDVDEARLSAFQSH